MCVALLAGAAWIAERTDFGQRIRKKLWGLGLRHSAKLMAEVPRRRARALETETLGSTPPPTVSHPSGIYTQAFRLAAEAPAGTEVLYTTDGSIPSSRSRRLTGSLDISRTVAVRLRAFPPGSRPSETLDLTYVIGQAPDVAVISLILDPVHLYDKHSGIYRHARQSGRAWERPVRLLVLRRGEPTLEASARLRVHGGASRRNLRKSLRIYLGREEADLRPLFGTGAARIAPSQSQWVLRHAGNNNQLFRDVFSCAVADRMGLITSPRAMCLLLTNGEIQGVYHLRERVNEALLAGKVGGERFDMLRGGFHVLKLKHGDDQDWRELWRFIQERDLRDPEAYRFVAERVDLSGLMDYWIFQAFSANSDWPQNNVDVYRARQENAPWRFLVWDMDGGYNYWGVYVEHETFAWTLRDVPRPEWKPHGGPDVAERVPSTLLLRRLTANPGFRAAFRKRCTHWLDTVLSRENLLAMFDRLVADREPLRSIELLRWQPAPPAVAEQRYREQIAQIRRFLEKRTSVVRRHLRKHFG
ncbi:MAG: CotH kinase family protein [Planctomycetota bacterium]